jgi:hypothetical protein
VGVIQAMDQVLGELGINRREAAHE